MSLQSFHIKAGNICIGSDALAQLQKFILTKNYSQIFVLTDANTMTYCLPAFLNGLKKIKINFIFCIDAGEENKNLESCTEIWKQLTALKADRKSLLINLGGGVVTDTGGFVAAIYKRGFDFVQVPTTLLAMIDASVGGKTGIDFEGYKNLLGSFRIPAGVYIYKEFLNTLSQKELLSGFAEMLKHGLIADKKIYQQLCRLTDLKKIAYKDLFDSISIKHKIATKDPDEMGPRKALNFGHTLGHALESYSLAHDKKPLLHGEAIAEGMILETILSLIKGLIKKQEAQEIILSLSNRYEAYPLKKTMFKKIMAYTVNDKKNEHGKVKYTLLKQAGKALINIDCTEEEVISALNEYMLLNKNGK